MKFCAICKQIWVWPSSDVCPKCAVDLALWVEEILEETFTDE